MYILKKFCGKRFDRINELLTQQSLKLNGYINLVASASYPFEEVLYAQSIPLTSFPIEGSQERRYFPASEIVDTIESRAELLIRELFDLCSDYRVSIQPHSGTQANQIVYNSVLKSKDRILCLAPSDGGHISHTVGIAKRNDAIHYRLDNQGLIDYNHLESLAKEYRPRLIIAGASSYPRAIDFERLGKIAKSAGAFLHGDISHSAIFHMTGIHGPVFPHADTASFNMMKNLRGPCGGILIFKKTLKKKILYSTFPLTQGGPIENILLGKYVAAQILSEMDLRKYAIKIVDNAKALSQRLLSNGINVVTGGTDSHLVVVDLSDLDITGVEIEQSLENNLILANRNLIPGDKRPPWVTSGIRLGTSCITTLGYEKSDVEEVADIVLDILKNPKLAARDRSKRLLEKFQKDLSCIW